jgi:predicted Ser/Thr protein kinase
MQLPADTPAGLCPKCLVQAGFESEPLPQPYSVLTVSIPPATGFEPPSVEDLAGKFPQLEMLELLGKGGMGAVYKARQRGLDRLVAVKVLPPEIGKDAAFAERFSREARALARLTHNHIVSVYDFGQKDGLFFIVMEYVDGVNLRQTIQSGGLAPAAALAIVPQICEALQYAHDEGIVHRDIKPENILLDKKGRVKIADFGLAKLLGHEAADQSLTGTHQVMGTVRYMAPEQMEGTRGVDHRADIYSLGVVFYEMLTGELPLGRFAPPSHKVQIDVRLDEVVLRTLEKEPARRYQHASDVKTDVETINRTPMLGRDSLPSAGVETKSGVELKPITLLDETMSRWKRALPGLPMLAGLICSLMSIPVALTGNNPFLLMFTAIGLTLWSIVLALIVNVGWTVEYRGHRIRFEYIILKYKRLMVDGWTAASGGMGWFYELRATIKEGQGIGDEIICTVEAAFLFRCRIIALPKTPILQAIESVARPESAKGVATQGLTKPPGVDGHHALRSPQGAAVPAVFHRDALRDRLGRRPKTLRHSPNRGPGHLPS